MALPELYGLAPSWVTQRKPEYAERAAKLQVDLWDAFGPVPQYTDGDGITSYRSLPAVTYDAHQRSTSLPTSSPQSSVASPPAAVRMNLVTSLGGARERETVRQHGLTCASTGSYV